MRPIMVTLSDEARRVVFTFLLSAFGLGLGACTEPAAGEEVRAPLATRTQNLAPELLSDERVALVPEPTSMAFAPDGRLFVAGRRGEVFVVAGGVLQPTPALDLVAICTTGERGLYGIALDPEFETHPYLYVHYAWRKGTQCSNRVERYTVGADNLVQGAPVVLVQALPTVSDKHAGGSIGFGPDGHLYVGVGDGYCDPSDSAACAHLNGTAPRLDSLAGKILRVTREGEIPSDNPYASAPEAVRCAVAGADVTETSVCAEIFARGFRNPAALTFHPQTGALYVTENGPARWEELNLVTAGGDYGWPARDGLCATRQTADCDANPEGLALPQYAYFTQKTCETLGGAAFIPRKTFEREFTGSFVFGQCGTLQRWNPAGAQPHEVFTSGTWVGRTRAVAFGPSNVIARPALYYTTLTDGGEVRRLLFTGEVNTAPVAGFTAAPASAPAPYVVTLDGSKSSDVDADALTYLWNFGDGSPVLETSQAKVEHRYPRGKFTASLVVRDSDGALSAAVSSDIEGLNSAPSLSALKAAPATGAYPLAVTLEAQGASDPNDDSLTYLWTFGDGAPPVETTGARVTHTYGFGDFTASLKVRDAFGAMSEGRTVRVSAVNSAPWAAWSAPVLSGPAPLTLAANASASSDANGNALTYRWSFGDGSAPLTVSVPSVTHTFPVGEYDVSLTVTDTHGVSSAPATQRVVVTNTAPEASLSADRLTGPAPLAVAFNASGSKDGNGHTLTYLWSFGDGSASIETEEPTLTHTFGHGQFEVTLKVRDALGAESAPVRLKVTAQNLAPKATLVASTTSGPAPLAVAFDAGGSTDGNGDALRYLWTFGDGSPAVETSRPAVSHVYRTGAFVASVVVTDVHGAASARAELTVKATNTAPTAALVATPASGVAPVVATLDGSASADANGDALTFLWSFGDGAPDEEGTMATVTHLYGPGTFEATLRVRDSHGALSEPATVTLTMTNTAPEARIVAPNGGNFTFAVGEEISLMGTATDEQEGQLPQDNLAWTVIFHDGPEARTFLEATGQQLSFVAPAPSNLAAASTGYLEVRLVATDAHGLESTVTQLLMPRKVIVQLDSVPTGLRLHADGQTVTTPATVTSWEGYTFEVGAPSQTSAGKWWSFSSWSDAGGQSHNVFTTAAAMYLNAEFRAGGSGTGLLAQYHDAQNFTGALVERVDPTLAFSWGTGAPAPGMGADTFSVRWLGRIEPVATDTYTFHVTSDDGIRVWVNGWLMLDDWSLHAARTRTFEVSMTAGQLVDIQVDYFEQTGHAVARLEWSSSTLARQVVPQAQLYPVALTPRTVPRAEPTVPSPEAYGAWYQALGEFWARVGALLALY